jgi:hypothetical protein
MFVIALAMTCSISAEADAGETLEATGRKAIANAKVVVDEVQEKAQQFTVNVILGGKDALERVTTLGKWTSALTMRATHPIKQSLDTTTWGRERSSKLPLSGATVHDGNLAIHQRLAREMFLRLSVSMDEEPVFTGTGDTHAAVGLSLIRSFD